MRKKKVKVSLDEVYIAVWHLMEDADILYYKKEKLYEEYETDFYDECMVRSDDFNEIARRFGKEGDIDPFESFPSTPVAFVIAMEAFANEKGVNFYEAYFELVKKVNLSLYGNEVWHVYENKRRKLSEEDKKNGYVDYLIVGSETADKRTVNKRKCMLKFPVSSFKDKKEIVEYLKKEKIIPNEKYGIECYEKVYDEVYDIMDKYKSI